MFLTDISNILSILNPDNLPKGVYRMLSRPGSFYFTHSLRTTITAPVTYFTDDFPDQFSLLFTIKPKENQNGFVFIIKDMFDAVLFGVEVRGRRLKVLYNSHTSHVFDIDILHSEWNYVAVSVGESHITVFDNCKEMAKTSINHLTMIHSNTVVCLVRAFTHNKHFQPFLVCISSSTTYSLETSLHNWLGKSPNSSIKVSFVYKYT